HGNIERIKCDNCKSLADKAHFLTMAVCENCHQDKLRPDVILFGEQLPQDVWNCAIDEVEKSELLIVIGTSLEVYPANQLPKMTKGKTV
ncbi:MAG: NAD-dependent protein deacylase, partial [Firmicutes bacterium]|nr:NAD-dependent protein deacylase [Bacillota bacterium]